MVELGGMLAAAILKVVGDQIGSAIGGQIKLHKKFDADLKKMRMALESVDAVLEDAERRSITDKSTLLWLKRLKDVMYAISEMIDEFEAHTQAITSAQKVSFQKYLAIMIPCLTIGPKIRMANKMEAMMEDLEVITDQHKKFKLAKDTNANVPKVTDIRETTSVMESQVVGRNTEKEEILDSLSESMHKDITILPIYGMGGLGKTTLAKMVYNSTQFKEYSHVWVYVSQTLDLMNIGNSIISQLSKEKKESEYTIMQMIHNSLQELLADKKILIVLDDLWEGEVFHLKSLMDMLKVGKDSTVVVIVTTRDEDIAKKICTIQPYKLAPLTDDMCWSIIKQKSAFESRGDKDQLEEIGKVIAMKCCGVALAANSLGYVLQSMMPNEWESVRDSNIWTESSLIDTSHSQVFVSLTLSYSVIPSYLKLCFVYCAIFPKGHKIAKDDLIHQWVSLGFSTWQLGERYISQLLGLSFLEHSKSPSTIELHVEDITFLTMHDLVHDLARSVIGDEIHAAGEGVYAKGSYYHYALLDDCSKSLGSELSKIRALRFMKCHNIKLHDAAFSSAKSLRVLDLSECSIHKIPDSIGVMKQLRYLNAPGIKHATIPDGITNLSKLIYLNLHGSPAILALPESTGEIEGLTYLNLSGCSGIEKLPASFGRIRELVHLDLSNCSSVGGISALLGSLTQLKYLNLSYCQNIGELPKTLGYLSKLQYLNLSSSSYLRHCQEAEVLATLTKLEYLNLSYRTCGLQKLPEALGRFTQLKYLNLSGCSAMKQLPRYFGGLKNLVHLDLSHCHSVGRLHEAMVGLSNLQYLNLQSTCTIELHVEDITFLTMHDLVHDLARLVIGDEIHAVGEGEDAKGSYCHYALLDDCSKSLGSEFFKIRALRFTKCHNIKLHDAAFSCAKSLRVLDLSECSIHKLPDSIGVMKQLRYLNAPGIKNAMIPRGITNLSKLIYLNLHGSPAILALPESIGEIEGLAYLDLSGCSRIEKLPESFGRLKELVHLDLSDCSSVVGISAFLGSLTQLKYLNLSYCPHIGKLPEALSYLSKLQYLNLSFSSYLQRCQEAEVLATLTKLEYLNLSSGKCGLQKLPEALGRFIQLKYLNLSGCSAMKQLPRLFGGLKNLVHLDLSYCYSVDRLHEALVGLSNLQYLNLKGTCVSLLPDDLTKLKYLNLSRLINTEVVTFDCLIHHISINLSNLEHLDLSENRDISSIPESISSLRKLHKLDLSDCSYLRKIPESIGTLNSLRFLNLNGCVGIKELPQLSSSALSLPHFPVQPGNGDSSSNLVLLQPTDPVELQITKLENVKYAGEAHHIKLMEKRRLKNLKLEWTRDVERFVDDRMLLEKLVPPRTLKKLEISGYNGFSFPSWLVSQVPNLKLLILSYMDNLEEWNTSYSSGEEYMVEKLRIVRCPKLRMKPLPPRANILEISKSDNVLSSWEGTNASSPSSPVTTHLTVEDCKVPVHQWRLLQHIPRLSFLCINNCGDLTGASETIEHLSFLERLTLIDRELEELPKWLGELTSLQRLNLSYCFGVRGFNENMRQLTKLQYLGLYCCNSMASLPHWLDELTSLKELHIFKCDVLRSLPESIQHLTGLQELEIRLCPELKLVVESEEGKMKLTHNQERVCLLPISLKELTISECDGIKSLPEGIEQLSNLQRLEIAVCDELKKWCELDENKMKLAHIKTKVYSDRQ